jgi:hypothetical protein
MSSTPDGMAPSPAQSERDEAARRLLYRSCGLALLEISAGIEHGTVVQRGAGPQTLIRIGFAQRARRLLRAAYGLIDNEMAPEAVGLLRTMSEYLIVMRWLALDPERNMKLWAKDDLRRSLLIDDKALEHGGFRLMDEETRGLYERERDELRTETSDEAEPVDVCEACGRTLKKAKKERLPTIEEMAENVDLAFAYNTAYRLDSQSAVHATGMAVADAFEEVAEGYLVRAEPHLMMGGIDSYAIGVHVLLDILLHAAREIPELGWMPHLELVQTTLKAITATHPESETAKARAAGTS